jgi:hypothetical protein
MDMCVFLTSESMRRHRLNSSTSSNYRAFPSSLLNLPLSPAEATKYSCGTSVQGNSYFQHVTTRRQSVQSKLLAMAPASLHLPLINTSKSTSQTLSSSPIKTKWPPQFTASMSQQMDNKSSSPSKGAN